MRQYQGFVAASLNYSCMSGSCTSSDWSTQIHVTSDWLTQNNGRQKDNDGGN